MSNPFDPPDSAVVAQSEYQRAGEYGLATLCVTSIGVCCTPAVLASPFLGAVALVQLRRANEAVTPGTADHLYIRVAKLGGWIGVTVGALYFMVIFAYIAILVVAVLADGGF